MPRKLTFLALFLTASCLQAKETGHYVWLEIPEIPTFERTLFSMSYVQEIKIHSRGTHVARTAKRSSSTKDSNRIEALIDGFKDFTISSFSIQSQVSPWIEVTLKSRCRLTPASSTREILAARTCY